MAILKKLNSVNLIDGKNLIVFCPVKAPINIIIINPIIITNVFLSRLSKRNNEKLVRFGSPYPLDPPFKNLKSISLNGYKKDALYKNLSFFM